MTRPSRHLRSARRPLNREIERDLSFAQPQTPLPLALNASTTTTSLLSRLFLRALRRSVTKVSLPALNLSGRRRVTAPIGVGSYGASEPAVAVATAGGGVKSAVPAAGPPVGRRLRPGELQAARRRGVVAIGEHDRDAPGTLSLCSHPWRQRGCSGARDGDTKKTNHCHRGTDDNTGREKDQPVSKQHFYKAAAEACDCELCRKCVVDGPPRLCLFSSEDHESARRAQNYFLTAGACSETLLYSAQYRGSSQFGVFHAASRSPTSWSWSLGGCSKRPGP